MSDIAPFVAATLRDKVVADLIEENKKLREDLTKARTVEITGQNGDPVLASALFSDGHYSGNPNLWEVHFPEEEDGNIPLSDLSDTEIRVGGIFRTGFQGSDDCQGFLDPNELDGDDQKVVNFCIGTSWLFVLVQGWPEASWRQVVEEEVATRFTTEVFDTMERLAEISREYEDATIQFLSVTFTVDTVCGAIDALSLDSAVEEDREERRARHALLGEVMTRMSTAGDERRGAPFMEGAMELFEALAEMDIYETGERFDSAIRDLIRLQQVTGGGEAFQNAVSQAAVGGNVDDDDDDDDDMDDNEENMDDDE